MTHQQFAYREIGGVVHTLIVNLNDDGSTVTDNDPHTFQATYGKSPFDDKDFAGGARSFLGSAPKREQARALEQLVFRFPQFALHEPDKREQYTERLRQAVADLTSRVQS